MLEILTIISTILLAILLLKSFKVDSKELKLDEILNQLNREFSNIRAENAQNSKFLREEILSSITKFQQSLSQEIFNFSKGQSEHFNNFAKNQAESFSNFSKSLDDLLTKNNANFEDIKSKIELKLDTLREDNNKQLDKMRATVDEKLTETLDTRLGEKFKLVSDRLEQVHKGLGEMQTLATGVGDLKSVLSRVKVRGIWGEVQLEQILSEFLTREQYSNNISTKPNSKDVVEFAIKIPSKSIEGEFIWLPIDVKFPLEDYEALVKAEQNRDIEALEVARKNIEKRIRLEAKDIFTKYIDPPNTTDFAILYLPIEGLYAEITQNMELVEQIRRDYRVTFTGPNTITAFLSSLQMGFRTLAIEKRTSEVWSLLSVIKNEFGKFGDMLKKTSKKLQETQNVIDSAIAKSNNIESKLGKVEALPQDTS